MQSIEGVNRTKRWRNRGRENVLPPPDCLSWDTGLLLPVK